MAIGWDRVGQPEFDRIVEALVHRLYDDTAEVQAVNGRGGDHGIDIRVVSGNRLRIFQLKYYPDGFAASMKGRRPSIKKSFERAMDHGPYEWTLVVPCTVTDSERAFIEGLAVGRNLTVRIMDRAELDDRLAAHSDIEASFTRDQLFEAAKVYGQEKAILRRGPKDLAERVQKLGRVADEVDPHWTMDFAREGDRVIQTLRGKHPRAHEVSPISLTFTGRSRGLSPELSSAMTRAFGYGVAEEVVLPPEAVKHLSISGPDWLTKTFKNVEVTWRPAGPPPGSGAPAELAFIDGKGRVTGSYAGKLSGLGSGNLGRSIDVAVPGGQIRILNPFNSAVPSKLAYNFSLEGLTPHDAMKAVRLRRRLLEGGDFQVTVDGQIAGAGQLPHVATPDVLRRLDQLHLFVEDLDVVQRHTDQYFPVPFELPAVDRIALRMARLLIDGRCVASPFSRTLTITVTGAEDPSMRQLLSGQPQSVRLTSPDCAVQIAGRSLELGNACMFHTRVVAQDGPSALAALDSGAVEKEIILRPADNERFRMFLTDTPDDGLPLTPTPFDLDGYPEPR
ncbi:hypothetical protein ACFXGT_30355 [Streptomyces sp. NPDC059352]|uniref:hypothetical protein n=1 Tax=Streptomyces sp. NPDC059352 TaxID=3346810 RepID=UPI00368527E9